MYLYKTKIKHSCLTQLYKNLLHYKYPINNQKVFAKLKGMFLS